jgi:predicted thioesterase
MSISLGLQAAVEHVVGIADTAVSMRSGEVPVLSTPRLLALCEEATIAALGPATRADVTSVGTRVELEHLGATGVGRRVSARAELMHVDGRLLRFEVSVHDGPDRLIAHGQITRVLVDRERFMARVPENSAAPEPR